MRPDQLEDSPGPHESPPSADLVRRALETVLDPELDCSIVELGFVAGVMVDSGHLTVLLQLPTAWCAAPFAYLMAVDVRRALLRLPGVRAVTVRLPDHFAAPHLEAAVNSGGTFADAFPAETEGTPEELRRTFLRKGFMARQQRVVDILVQAGLAFEDLCRLTVGHVRVDGDLCVVLRDPAPPLPVGPAGPVRQYLDRRVELGIPTSSDSPFLVDAEGRPVDAPRLKAYLRWARTVRVSLDANGVLCRALLAARGSSLSGRLLFELQEVRSGVQNG